MEFLYQVAIGIAGYILAAISLFLFGKNVGFNKGTSETAKEWNDLVTVLIETARDPKFKDIKGEIEEAASSIVTGNTVIIVKEFMEALNAINSIDMVTKEKIEKEFKDVIKTLYE